MKPATVSVTHKGIEFKVTVCEDHDPDWGCHPNAGTCFTVVETDPDPNDLGMDGEDMRAIDEAAIEEFRAPPHHHYE